MSAIGWLQGVILRRVPDFLRGPVYSQYMESFALVLDGHLQTLRQGLTFGNPLLCPEDCLPGIAKDRNIPLHPSIPVDAQRRILADWLMLHRLRGSDRGVLRMLRYLFEGQSIVPAMRIVHASGDGASCEWTEMDAAGKITTTRVEPSNFNYDSHGDEWARWFLVLDDSVDGAPVPWLNPPVFYDADDALYDSGCVWDGMSKDPALAILQTALWARRGGTRLQAIIVDRKLAGSPGLNSSSTLTIDSSGWTSIPITNWGSSINLSTGEPTRPPYLSFIYEAG